MLKVSWFTKVTLLVRDSSCTYALVLGQMWVARSDEMAEQAAQ